MSSNNPWGQNSKANSSTNLGKGQTNKSSSAGGAWGANSSPGFGGGQRNQAPQNRKSMRLWLGLAAFGIIAAVTGLSFTFFNANPLTLFSPSPTPLAENLKLSRYYPAETRLFMSIDVDSLRAIEDLLLGLGIDERFAPSVLISQILINFEALGIQLPSSWGNNVSLGNVLTPDGEKWLLAMELLDSATVIQSFDELVSQNLLEALPAQYPNESRYQLANQIVSVRDNVLLIYDSTLIWNSSLAEDTAFQGLLEVLDADYPLIIYTNYSDERPAELNAEALPITISASQSIIGVSFDSTALELRWISKNPPPIPGTATPDAVETSLQVIDEGFERFIPANSLFALHGVNFNAAYQNAFGESGLAAADMRGIVDALNSMLQIVIGLDYQQEMQWMDGDYAAFIALNPERTNLDWGIVLEASDAAAPRALVNNLGAGLSLRASLMEMFDLNFFDVQYETISTANAISIDIQDDLIPADFLLAAQREVDTDLFIIGSRAGIEAALAANGSWPRPGEAQNPGQLRLILTGRSVALVLDFLALNQSDVPPWLSELATFLGENGQLELYLGDDGTYQDLNLVLYQ